MNKVRIKAIENTTHDVKHITVERPKDLEFTPGQAVDVSIDKLKWREEKRPFTFTSLPADTDLEFNIKIYPDHNGVTNQIAKLEPGDYLFLDEVFGAIEYKGEGIFLAGGAGITPFIAIFKDLKKQGKLGNNKLIFANKTHADIILNDYFQNILGDNFINTLSQETVTGYNHGHITKAMIAQNSMGPNAYYYLCGPPPMMDAVLEHLDELGVAKSQIVMEDF